MADNVDLMVVGAADGLSADELTQKLVAEFRQPAEAFKQLVEAACLGEPAYAAQTSVSLETAVEGQMQLENLGVVCQLLKDGQEFRGTGRSLADNNDEQPVVEAVEEFDDLSEQNLKPAEDVAAAVVEDDEAAEEIDLSGEIANEEDFSGFEEDIEALGSVAQSAESSATDESAELSEDSVNDGGEISFQDELGSLDDDLQRVSQARKTKPVEAKTPAEDVPVKDDDALLELDNNSGESIELDKASTDSVADSTSDSTDNQTTADSLELSLSDDDSQPLTKPKAKSNNKADDGGLTLSLDDNTPLTAPKKQSASTPPPSDGGLTLSLEDDAPAKEITDSGVEEKSEQPQAEAESESAVTPEPVAEVEEPAVDAAADEGSSNTDVRENAVEARDTSREVQEDIKPLLDEPEPQKADTSPEPAAKPKHEENTTANPVDVEDKQEPAAGTDNAAATPAPKAESSSSIDSLIEDLTSNAGGLVLPGQAPVEGSVDEVIEEQPVISTDVDVTAKSAIGGESAVTAELSNGVDLDAGVDTRAADSDHLEVLVEKEHKSKLLKTATLATVAVGLLGGGAAFYFMGGLPGAKGQAPVVATSAPAVNENSALDAVEEVSLNAAIERSSEVSNPNNYTTEELIVYLSDNLGVNAKQELQNYVNGGAEPQLAAAKTPVPRMGPAIPADSNSVLWLKNRVAHPADEYFDEWAAREVGLQAYMELQERLIEVGDLEIAKGIGATTKDQLFAVMSLQRLARSYHELGHSEKAMESLESAARGTYGIESEAERVIAIADFAFTEKSLGLEEDSLDTFLKASILARSLRKPESRTVALSSIAEYYDRVNREDDTKVYLELAMASAYKLPVNTAARDLAIRHVALTEVKLGLTTQATEHANLIVDPFAAVSALHGIALELERTGDQTNARLTLNMAYRAGSLIKNSEKREKLLEKIKLAGG